jgi:hypothetical protein
MASWSTARAFQLARNGSVDSERVHQRASGAGAFVLAGDVAFGSRTRDATAGDGRRHRADVRSARSIRCR